MACPIGTSRSCWPSGVSPCDLAAARRFFTRALRAGTVPAEVTTDRAPAYPRVLDELILSALHTVERYANNPVEADHGRLKARLRPMRGMKRYGSARKAARRPTGLMR
jgi:transposase-like protein